MPVGVKTRVTNKIAWMCSQDLKPFAMVEGQGFMTVAQELLDIGSKYGGTILAEDLLLSARTVSSRCGRAQTGMLCCTIL